MYRIGDVIYRGHRQMIIKYDNHYYIMNPFVYLASIHEYRTTNTLDPNHHMVCDTLTEAKELAIMCADSNYYYLDKHMKHREYLDIINTRDYSLELFDIEEITEMIGGNDDRSPIIVWKVEDKIGV